MKKIILGVSILLAFNVLINAQGSKIGVVDANVVFQQSAKGKRFLENHQKFIKQKQNEISVLRKQYTSKQKDFQAKAPSMNQDAIKQASAELKRLRFNIQNAQEDAQREFDLKLRVKFEQFQKELAPLIRQVALEKGLDLVLTSDSNFVFISDRINITNDLVRKHDALGT